MGLGVKTDTFNYDLVCGLPKPYRSAFDLDPEVKEERVWMEGSRGMKVTFFERNSERAWILDREERLADYSGELLPTESVLSQLREPHLYPELSALRAEMNQWRFYHHFRTDHESPLRHPQVGVERLSWATTAAIWPPLSRPSLRSARKKSCMMPSVRPFPARLSRSITTMRAACLPFCCACRD